ncbi:hypothetical protein [Streptomyces sp. C10]|uniref:hypothetical protein n=1 Tax=Streptomyces sp. C10 TaxID=531941 RepID=UPI003980CA94
MTDASDALADALRRDAAALLKQYRSGAWVPCAEERDLAEDLARMQWNAHSLRANLREIPAAVRAGRLVDVLDPAVAVAEQAGAATADGTLLQLRRLVDALTAPLNVVGEGSTGVESGTGEAAAAGADS